MIRFRTPRLGLPFLLSVVTVLLLVLAACTPAEDTAAPEPDADEAADPAPGDPDEDAPAPADDDRTLRIAIPDDVETLDPAFGQAELTNLVLKNVYAQPIQYVPGEGQNGWAYADTTSFEGQTIESWEFNDDRTELTLNLRQGMRFPVTGNEVTVDDFVWSMERAFGTAAGPAWVWTNIGVESMDQVSVEGDAIVLSDLRPSAIAEPLMRDQTLGLLDSEEVQQHATDDDEWAMEWLARNYAGNGRYLVASWETGTRMVLEANPEWWGEEPYFTRVELQVVPESANRLAFLQDGTVDIALDLSTQELAQAEGADGVQVLSIPDRAALNLGMNLTSEPFDDVRVRQALAYATPYQQVVDGVLQGRAVASQGPMSVHSRFFDAYDLGDLWMYETDPDRASELLEEAGYGDGFSFDLVIPQGLPYVEETATNLRAAFSDVGVEMNIQPVSAAAMAERLAQRDFDAFLRGYLLDYVDDPYYHFFLWFTSDAVLNWVGYNDPTVDRVAEETATVVDDEERREPYREGIGQLIEDAPMLWIANGDSTFAMRDDITGFVHHPDALLTFAPLERSG